MDLLLLLSLADGHICAVAFCLAGKLDMFLSGLYNCPEAQANRGVVLLIPPSGLLPDA